MRITHTYIHLYTYTYMCVCKKKQRKESVGEWETNEQGKRLQVEKKGMSVCQRKRGGEKVRRMQRVKVIENE